jgi:dihydrodipicolinate synthase/N-acetylneuraminate lyase
MNNEPVAWMSVNELNGSYSTFTNDQKQRLLPHVSQCYGKWIPLYTHPVKELTDEEIRHIQAICHLKDVGYDNFIMRFARAILRKAQEQ